MMDHAEEASLGGGTVVKLTMFVTAIVVLLVMLFQQQNAKSEVYAKVQAGKARRMKLLGMEVELSRMKQQARSDKDTFIDIMGACREASDIPDLSGPLIVVGRSGRAGASFYVPDGSHRLIVTATWHVLATSRKKQKASEQSKSWEYDLPGSAGYMLKLVRVGERQYSGFELAGNHPDFTVRKASWPFGNITSREPHMHTYVPSPTFFYPNEVSSFSNAPQMLELAAKREPRQLHKFEGSFRDGYITTKVTILAKIVSKTLPSVAAKGDALYLPASHPEWFVPYDGQGRYLVKPAALGEIH